MSESPTMIFLPQPFVVPIEGDIYPLSTSELVHWCSRRNSPVMMTWINGEVKAELTLVGAIPFGIHGSYFFFKQRKNVKKARLVNNCITVYDCYEFDPKRTFFKRDFLWYFVEEDGHPNVSFAYHVSEDYHFKNGSKFNVTIKELAIFDQPFVLGNILVGESDQSSLEYSVIRKYSAESGEFIERDFLPHIYGRLVLCDTKLYYVSYDLDIVSLDIFTLNYDIFRTNLAIGSSIAGIIGNNKIYCQSCWDRAPTHIYSVDMEIPCEQSALKREPVQVRAEEKLIAVVPREGGLKSAEILGSVSVNVATAEFNTVALQMRNNSDATDGVAVQIQLHPYVDKDEWSASSLLRLKYANKPFPVSYDVVVLKWRATIHDDESLPIVLNVWPQEAPDGCQVNIEYTLQRTNMTLNDVVITVPLPTSTTPVVAVCEGSYEYQKSRNQLIWTIPVIDASNASGTLEFVTPNGAADHFFPVSLRFSSTDLLVDIGVEEVQKMDGIEAVTYSSISHVEVEKYDIV